MPLLSARITLLWLAVLVPLGCTQVKPVKDSLLKRVGLPPESLVLDIFFVRCPMDDPRASELLWHEIDEQHFDSSLRRRLHGNGFRVGVIAGQIPVPLSELLELKGMSAPSAQSSQSAETGQVQATELASDAKVVRRHLQIRAGRRSEIIASGIYDELPVLVRDRSGNIEGKTYPKAQALFAIHAIPEYDGRVRLVAVPEVHFGEIRQQVVPGQGTFRLEAGRSRRVFDEMTTEATLGPGHMLVIAALPDRPGSLGHHFLTECNRGKLEQRLLVVRLSQTQHDGLFSP